VDFKEGKRPWGFGVAVASAGPYTNNLGDSLDDRQFGTRRHRSTMHALVDMMHHWHTAVDNGESVGTVNIDFAKAFDRVDHSVLVVKLVALGLPDVIVRWTGAFL